jgi:hypothetical protein
VGKPTEGAMVQVEDFTSLPSGFEVPLEGRVQTCPRCGRNGIEEHPECGDPYFLHRQTTDLQSDGMLTEPLDCCSLKSN